MFQTTNQIHVLKVFRQGDRPKDFWPRGAWHLTPTPAGRNGPMRSYVGMVRYSVVLVDGLKLPG